MTTKRLLSLAASALLVFGVASMAMAGIPDETQSTASSASGCLQVVPNGTGDALSSKGLTVTVTVLDGNGDPIAGYPFQDVGLADNVGGADVTLCTSGWLSSANTNAAGVTTITGAGFAGGSTQGGMRATLAGVRITNGPALDIDVVSPDMDGDLDVDLLDLSAVPTGFAARFLNGVYDFQSDYTCDGAENLLDVVEFSFANGVGICP
jgi:hypothetical protein